MKKLLFAAVALFVSVQLYAQGPLHNFFQRFEDPGKGKVAYIKKGTKTLGIRGGYRNLNAAGLAGGDGYSILSLLNIGSGQAQLWNVAPKFDYFVADDLSLGVRLEYSGYLVDTDLKLDFRDILGGILDYDASDPADAEALAALNVQVSSRHMVHHKGGLSIVSRKYLSFFGSSMFAVFGEAALFGSYGVTTSHPREENTEKIRYTNTLQLGLKVAGGLAVRFRDGSTVTASIPLFGAGFTSTAQDKVWLNAHNKARMNAFNVSRTLDFLGLQIGYFRSLGK